MAGGCIYGSYQSFDAGGVAVDAVTIDVDGDGNLDLVIAQHRAAFLTVRLGGDHGILGATWKLRLPKGAAPSDLATGRFRKGARPALVVGNRGGDSISIFERFADGGGPTKTIPLGSGAAPGGLAVADLDLDGDDDLLVTSRQPSLGGCDTDGCVLVFRDKGAGLAYALEALPLGEPERNGRRIDYDPRGIGTMVMPGDKRPDIFVASRGTDEVVVIASAGRGYEPTSKYTRIELEKPETVDPFRAGDFFALLVETGIGRGVLLHYAKSNWRALVSDFSLPVARGPLGIVEIDAVTGRIQLRGAGHFNEPEMKGAKRVLFAPLDGDSVRARSALVVAVRDGGSVDDAIMLRADGTVGVLLSSMAWGSPRTVDFGTVEAGTSTHRTIEAKVPTIVRFVPEIGITGADAESFRAETCPGLKPRGGTCRLEFTFAPTTAGEKRAVAVVRAPKPESDSDFQGRISGEPVRIELRGTASAPPQPRTEPLRVGVADDYGKYAADAGAWFFGELRALGMTENRMTVLWRSGQVAPDPVETAFLDRSVARAQADGVALVFSVYPGSASAHDPAQFCPFVRGLAQRYPYVREFIVGNEPNKADFWSPVDPAAYTQLLAACYDALKPLGVTVIGGALSPRSVGRGMSPVLFLAGMGAEYRRLARTAPLLDMLSHHPYPNPERIGRGVDAGYDWPNAGIPDLDRLKQVFEDAFAGTAQPTFATTLKLKLDEVGWQANVLPPLASLYTGAENSATVEEAQQAEYYRTLIGRISCDADVAELLLFHLIDEKELNASAASGGWQSGLLRIDRSRRPSFDAVGAAIGAGCTGGAPAWTPAATVVGGRAAIGAVQQQVRVRGKPQRGVKFTFEAAAAEGVSWRIEVKNATGKVVAAKSGARDAPFDASTFVTPVLVGAGSYTATLKLSAATNGTRTLTASKTAASKP